MTFDILHSLICAFMALGLNLTEFARHCLLRFITFSFDCLDFTELTEYAHEPAAAESNITDMAGSGSGGGSGAEILSVLEPDLSSILATERAGQMYVYRYNDTTVTLGTRSRKIFGAAVGIGEISNGSFRCMAVNQQYKQDEEVFVLIVKSKQTVIVVHVVTCSSLLEPRLNVINYIRFSTIRFNEIAHDASIELVPNILSTAILHAIGVDLEEQQIVDCEPVAKYVSAPITRECCRYGFL